MFSFYRFVAKCYIVLLQLKKRGTEVSRAVASRPQHRKITATLKGLLKRNNLMEMLVSFWESQLHDRYYVRVRVSGLCCALGQDT